MKSSQTSNKHSSLPQTTFQQFSVPRLLEGTQSSANAGTGSTNRFFLSRFSSVLTAVLNTALTTVALMTIALGSQVQAAETTPGLLTIGKAVEKSRSQSSGLKALEVKTKQAETQIPLAKSTLYPNLSLILSGQEQKDALNSKSVSFNGEPYNTYKTDLKLSQTLYQFGALTAVDAAEKDRKTKQLDVEIFARDLTNNVIVTYYQLVLNLRNLDTLKRQEIIVKDSLNTTEHRSRTGRSQTLDVLQVKTQLALLKSQINEASNQVQIAAANLNNLIGEQGKEEKPAKSADDRIQPSFFVKNSLDAPEPSMLDQQIKLSQFRIPELEKNTLQIDLVGDQRRISKGKHYPILALSADYIYSNLKSSDLFNSDSNSWSAGLTLTVPLFSGFSSRYEQAAYTFQENQLVNERKSIEDKTNLDQVVSRKKLETAAQAILQGQETLKIAKSSLDEARRMYRLSTIDLTQFLNIQNSYVQAEGQLNQFKYSYITALTNYFVASGQNVDQLVEILERANR